MKQIKDTTYKGTQILLGNEKRGAINLLVDVLLNNGFTEISIPIIQAATHFVGKVGEENQHMMFTLTDAGGRNLCLAPEYTAIVQQLASSTFKYQPDTRLFYVQECFRGEKPQAGRYRQFTQFGVEIVNPRDSAKEFFLLSQLACMLVEKFTDDYELDNTAKRGLDYYKEGQGFEIRCPKLGAQSQVCGGGQYDGGVGFALGIDRLLLLNEKIKIN